MSVLSHVFEQAGLATVGISIVRGQAESVRPPRSLYCEFPLGRPLGKPNDPAFQTDVVMAMLALLDRTDVPVLEDYPEIIEEQGSEASSCPLPPRHDPSLPAPIDELRGLRNAYERNLEATGGRTLVGRVAPVDELDTVIEKFIQVEAGTPLADVGWDEVSIIAASQDLRAFYEEAGLQLADNTGARQLLTWFYEATETGRLLVRVRDVLKAGREHKLAAMYVVPGTQESPA